jgi:aminoglycoside phosphotransferase (APT) family kinase protein
VSAPTPLSGDALAAALGRVLGGTVQSVARLSGGASRVTSAFDLVAGGDATVTPLIVQQDRGAGLVGPGRARMEAALLRAAAAAGVPVPAVVAGGDGEAEGMGTGWVVVERVEGETIPRKILRDAPWAQARAALVIQCGQALAAIHAIDPDSVTDLTAADPLRDPLPVLDDLNEVRPALELGARWLALHPAPPGPRVTVHGDFRMGNLLVGPEGLRAVLDWELAHAGDPAEDLGWLSAPAWRFGGPGAVAGVGSVEDLLGAYAAAGGAPVTAERLHWWQVYATVKWATICALQASSHLRGTTRSVELAAIGRRVCESEWDLFVLLGVKPVDAAPDVAPPIDLGGAPSPASAPFGRPTAGELVEAVREQLEEGLGSDDAGARYRARVTRNALAMVERELRDGAVLAAAHAARLASLGCASDAALAAAIRAGTFDDEWRRVAGVLASSARDQLLVANPGYLPEDGTEG